MCVCVCVCVCVRVCGSYTWCCWIYELSIATPRSLSCVTRPGIGTNQLHSAFITPPPFQKKKVNDCLLQKVSPCKANIIGFIIRKNSAVFAIDLGFFIWAHNAGSCKLIVHCICFVFDCKFEYRHYQHTNNICRIAKLQSKVIICAPVEQITGIHVRKWQKTFSETDIVCFRSFF